MSAADTDTPDDVSMCFELAAVLAELLLNIRAIGEAAHASDLQRLVPALAESVALEAEARAALMRFHRWAEPAP